MANFLYDPHFRDFSKKLRETIAKYDPVHKDDLLEFQRKQMENLIDLEDQYRKILISHPVGVEVYQAFITYIKEEKSTILSARPYFRERSSTFEGVSYAIKNNLPENLFPFSFNYNFIHITKKLVKLPTNIGLQKLDKEIKRVRNDMMILNMPLAINRAKMFYDKVPKDFLSYLDAVQICCEGLASGIDKFVPPPGGMTKVFRSVLIGRMVGELIEANSATLLHFFPNDRRKIYHSNKLVRFHKGSETNYESLSKAINDKKILDTVVTPEEISMLMSAASHISSDSYSNDNNKEEEIRVTKMMANRFVSDSSVQPDVMVEKADLQDKLQNAMQCLSVFENKILRLKGV